MERRIRVGELKYDGSRDFGFALDCSVFSDKVLNIVTGEGEQIPGPMSTRVHVNSAILAERSCFFRKMITCGLKESREDEIVVHIQPSELSVMQQLLHFIYTGGTRDPLLPPDLVALLQLADQFAVPSCVTCCVEHLSRSPVDRELANLFLTLPENIRQSDAARVLSELGRQFYASCYLDMSSAKSLAPTFNKLSVEIVETVLRNEYAKVDSELEILGLVSEYIRSNVPEENLEERQALMARLGQCVRFPLMSTAQLRHAKSLPEMRSAAGQALIDEALWYKASSPEEQEEMRITEEHHRFLPRPDACIIDFSIPLDTLMEKNLEGEGPPLEEIRFISDAESTRNGVQFQLGITRSVHDVFDEYTFGAYLILASSSSPIPSWSPTPYHGGSVKFSLLIRSTSLDYVLLQDMVRDCSELAGRKEDWCWEDIFNGNLATADENGKPYIDPSNNMLHFRAYVSVKDFAQVASC